MGSGNENKKNPTIFCRFGYLKNVRFILRFTEIIGKIFVILSSIPCNFFDAHCVHRSVKEAIFYYQTVWPNLNDRSFIGIKVFGEKMKKILPAFYWWNSIKLGYRRRNFFIYSLPFLVRKSQRRTFPSKLQTLRDYESARQSLNKTHFRAILTLCKNKKFGDVTSERSRKERPKMPFDAKNFAPSFSPSFCDQNFAHSNSSYCECENKECKSKTKSRTWPRKEGVVGRPIKAKPFFGRFWRLFWLLVLMSPCISGLPAVIRIGE